jgi:aspartokinase
VVGSLLDDSHHLTAEIFASLRDVRLLAQAYSPSHSSISFVVETEAAEILIAHIHALILKQRSIA